MTARSRTGRFDYDAAAWVYRIYAASGKLLYVGFTRDLLKRLGEHRSRHYRFASYMEWECFDDVDEAKSREAELIWRLRPWDNHTGAQERSGIR